MAVTVRMVMMVVVMGVRVHVGLWAKICEKSWCFEFREENSCE